MLTPALRNESSCTRLFTLSASKLIDVNILSEALNVISVPVSFDALIFFSLVVAMPSLYFCSYMPPSLQIVKVSSLERAFTTDTPTP